MAQDMDKLLKEERLFELRDRFAQAEGLSKSQKLYFRAYIDNAFGRLEESNKAIDTLTAKYKSQFKKKKLAELMLVKSDNHTKQFQYAQAAAALQKVLDDYSKSINKSYKKDIANSMKLWHALSDVPPQVVHHSGDTQVPITKNQFGNWMIPVSNSQHHTIQFIFDSGANLSTVRKGIAEKMGVVFTGSKIDVGNSVGTTIEAEYGYIPSLSIGNLRVDNVVVLVMPDEMLTFDIGNFTIDGIIGFPVIRGLGEFSISRDGELRIAAENSDVKFQNIFTKGLMPFVQIEFKGESLSLVFDTGAGKSQLSKRYHDSHKQDIKANSTIVKNKMGGVGKVVEIKNRVLENPVFEVAGHSIALPSIDILNKNIFRDKRNDGFFGQDLLLQPGEAVMNFRDMYMFFRE